MISNIVAAFAFHGGIGIGNHQRFILFLFSGERVRDTAGREGLAKEGENLRVHGYGHGRRCGDRKTQQYSAYSRCALPPVHSDTPRSSQFITG